MIGVVAGACDSEVVPTTPSFGYVRITAIQSGDDVDLDGFLVLMDAKPAGNLKDPQVASVLAETGTHEVALGDLAPNCTLVGPSSRSVTV